MKVHTHLYGVIGKNEISDILEDGTGMGMTDSLYVLDVLLDHLKYLQKNIENKDLKKSNQVVIKDLKIFIKKMSIKYPCRIVFKAIE